MLLTCSILSTIITFYLLKIYGALAKKYKIFDDKNLNYAFKKTITGSGITFFITFLIGNLFLYFFYSEIKEIYPNRYYIFLVSISILSILCFIDDLRSLDPIFRLIVQLLAIYISIVCFELNEINFKFKIVILTVVILWIYILNITNFIDGSDGFLTLNMFFFWIGFSYICYVLELNLFSKYFLFILLPIILVFFYFNKPKAKLFMGDAGSIFFGYLTGFAIIELCIEGHVFLALSLYIYPILDCSITLFKKVFIKKIMPWVGLYDYYFLIPVMQHKSNHKNLLYLISVFYIINSFFIYLQINLNKLFILASLIWTIIILIVLKFVKLKILRRKISKLF